MDQSTSKHSDGVQTLNHPSLTKNFNEISDDMCAVEETFHHLKKLSEQQDDSVSSESKGRVEFQPFKLKCGF